MNTPLSRRPRVALELWGPDPIALVQTAVVAERLGLDAVYLGESPTALNAETWTTLGLVAASTSTLRFGPVIANLLDDYRSPVLLARQGATLARASAGRFDFRTGVGASRDAGRRWWEPAGVGYPAYGDRWAMADRQLGVLRRLWRGDEIDLGDGAFSLGFEHPPIPITVAARGARGLDLVRRHANRWEASYLAVDEFASARDAAALDDHITTSLEVDGFVGGDDGARVWDRAQNERAGEDLTVIRRRSLHGGAGQVAGQIRALHAAGVEQLVVALHDPHDLDAIETLAAAVARAELAD
ncbi:MAG: LLM class flavin-dependent oxidoreductase [Actinomycetota bacterium]